MHVGFSPQNPAFNARFPRHFHKSGAKRLLHPSPVSERLQPYGSVRGIITPVIFPNFSPGILAFYRIFAYTKKRELSYNCLNGPHAALCFSSSFNQNILGKGYIPLMTGNVTAAVRRLLKPLRAICRFL